MIRFEPRQTHAIKKPSSANRGPDGDSFRIPTDNANKKVRPKADFLIGSPDGIRTRVTGLKGQRPRPLDDGATDGMAHRT